MAYVEVRDYVIWTRHIRGAPQLAERLASLPAGKTVSLQVDGVSGLWEKMRDRPDGTRTPGLKPVGEVARHWRKLFEAKRGQLVEMSLDVAGPPSLPSSSEAERDAAWNVLKTFMEAGWRSDRPYGDRDELYER